MMSCRRLVGVMLCLSGLQCAAQSTPSLAQGTSSKIWVGRYHEIEEYLRTAECLTLERLGSDTSSRRCVLRPGGPVARMAWLLLPPGIYRGFFTSYKTQIAAYELDKMLKMDMLPPTVERQLQGSTGAATLWVEHVDTWKGDAPPPEINRAQWARQVARIAMFDAFIGNQDRNQANVLRDDAWNLILLDHTRAFGPVTEISHPLTRIDKDFWDRILALTRKELDAKLRPWLDDDQIASMMGRRERMKGEIDRLIAERGAAAVVLP